MPVHRKHAFAALIATSLALTAHPLSALDLSQPATLKFTLRDQTGNPIPGVQITLARQISTSDNDLAPLHATTDSAGIASLSCPPQAPNPDDPASLVIAPAWDRPLTLQKDGLFPQTQTLRLFPGAQIEKSITLLPAIHARLHVLDSAGRPVPGAPLNITRIDTATGQRTLTLDLLHQSTTDSSGIFAFDRPSTGQNVSISVWRSETQFSTGQTDATLTLSPTDLETAPFGKTIQGRLLLPDGSPAKDWSFSQGDASIDALIEGIFLITGYGVPRLEPVANDGTFTAPISSNTLFFVSPQGIPLKYDLNPASWNQSPRHLTLTLTPMRTIHGQVTGDNDQPAPNIRLQGTAFSSHNAGGGWSFCVDGQQRGWTVNGKTLGAVTDDQGNYDILMPRGTDAQLEPEDKPVIQSLPVSPTATHIFLRTWPPPTRTAPQHHWKDLTIQFTDSAGNIVPNVGVDAQVFSDGGRTLTGASSQAFDIHGTHLFLDPAATRIQIQTNNTGWNTDREALDLRGPEGERRTHTLNENLRWKPLDGQLTDPDRNPVPGATVYVSQPSTSNNNLSKISYLGISIKTDPAGHFHFPQVPPDAYLEFSRYSADGNSQNLPGWLPPTPISGATTDVQLRPGSTVRVLIPENAVQPGDYLAAEAGGEAHNTVNNYLILKSDPATHAFIAENAPPGQYTLRPPILTSLNAQADETFTVTTGKDTQLDWRNRTFTPADTAQEQWQSITLKTPDGKPPTAAEVYVYAEDWPLATITQWITDWPTASPQDRAQIAARLSRAFDETRDVLDTLPDSPARNNLLGQLKAPNQYPSDCLQRVALDLSDDAGTVRFKGFKGHEYIAVAIVPGKWTGIQRFIAADTPATITLKPSRTVAVDLSKSSPSPGLLGKDAPLIFTSPAGIESRALARALSGESLEQIPRAYLVGDPLDSHTRAFDDLPIGANCTLLSSTPNPAISALPPPLFTFTVAPGNGPQTVVLPTDPSFAPQQ